MNVAAIVLNWNRIDETAACCRSIAQQTHRNLSILVVDNGSNAHTAEDLKHACPPATVLPLDRNLGFAGGVNEGIRASLSNANCSYVWLVNNDTDSDPDTLEKLVAAAEANPLIGLAGNAMSEGKPGTATITVSAGKRLRPPFFIPVPPKSGESPDYLSGASLLIRRKVFEDIGLFDDGFFFFFEDADFSRRAIQKGWELAVAPNIAMRHLGSATIGSLSEMQALHYRAGHIRFLRKHVRHPFPPALFCAVWRILCDTARGNSAALRGSWKGWRKGWRDPIAHRFSTGE